jgi:DNA-binding CsgD family transcriptional regulator
MHRSQQRGNPFLVEELLAGLVASGALRIDVGEWTTTGHLVPAVPFDFAESIEHRLSRLDDVGRRVLRAAAMLGVHFDWELLATIVEVAAQIVLDALRAAVREQVVAIDGDGFMFRHALTREVVVGELLPPERRDLARRALPTVEQAHPGLPGSWCELAAELAEAAGDPVVAARYLIECSSRALVSGAFATAEAAASRARVLAAADEATGIEVDEVLVRALALAGKAEQAAVVGRSLLDRLGDSPVDRRVDLLLVLARAAIAGGDLVAAASHLDEARALVGRVRVADSTAAPVEAVAAHVALAEGRLDEAEVLARSAVDRAVATGQPEIECEALEVIGRVVAYGGGDGSVWLQRAADVAERSGLAGWELRARHELALGDWAVRGRTDPLRATRDLAVRHGALVTVAVMDLALADAALFGFDRDGCLEAASRCVEASRRFGLATLPVAHLWLAGAHALAGRDEEMNVAIDNALERDPDDPRILGDLWGRVRATRSMVRDDRVQLRADLDEMMMYVRVAPVGTSMFPNRLLWALLRIAEDDDHGASATDELGASFDWWPLHPVMSDVFDLVAEGRQHPTVALRSRFDDASRQLLGAPAFAGVVYYTHIVVAEAALRDGWGDPVSWLRLAEAFFRAGGYDLIARRCRRLLTEAGAPAPRRGRGESEVPLGLRSLGITSRELDVLKLVAEGLSNRAISERLYVSPKTVERHVASLFDRTGVRNRKALADFAESQTE